MDPIALSLLLLAGAVILLVGELLLPTHGILGLMGLICLAGAIGTTFYINRWLGLGILFTAVVASPFVWAVGLRIWERSPVGRRVLLPPTEAPRQIIPVKLGQVGTAFSEMRPMGEVDFDDQRMEAISERGIIRAGQKVKVMSVTNGIPTVRAV